MRDKASGLKPISPFAVGSCLRRSWDGNPLLTIPRHGWGMRYLIFLLALAACDLPSPIEPVAGRAAQVVMVQGSSFSVRYVGSEAVAVRKNFDFRARRHEILPRAGIAIERVSGCRVRPGSLTGDVARIEAKIDC